MKAETSRRLLVVKGSRDSGVGALGFEVPGIPSFTGSGFLIQLQQDRRHAGLRNGSRSSMLKY